MKKTIYHGFLMPEGTDAVDVQNFNDNFEDVDEILHDLEQNTGDISKSTVNATIATTRTNVTSGDSIGTIVGKVMKWFTDIKDAAFCAVANNLTTTAAGSVLDARQGKALNDSLTTHNTQLGGLYFGTNSAGKWGYKTSANGSVTPFRQPTGNAGTGDVLVGKTFANASSDALTGTMPNNGSMTATLTPTGNNSVTKTIPAGYTTGGTITANGAAAYAAGVSAADARVSTSSASFVAGQKDVCILVAMSNNGPANVSKTITAGTYRLVFMAKAYSAYTEDDAVYVNVGGASYYNVGWGEEKLHFGNTTLTLPAGTCTVHVSGSNNYGMFSGLAVLYKVV